MLLYIVHNLIFIYAKYTETEIKFIQLEFISSYLFSCMKCIEIMKLQWPRSRERFCPDPQV